MRRSMQETSKMALAVDEARRALEADLRAAELRAAQFQIRLEEEQTLAGLREKEAEVLADMRGR